LTPNTAKLAMDMKGRSKMKKWISIFITLCIFLFSGMTYTANASTYYFVGDYYVGPLTFSPLPTYTSNLLGGDTSSEYRVFQWNWSVTNPTSETFNDVAMIQPFAWFNVGGIQAFSWDNTNQRWENSDETLWVEVNNVPLDTSDTPAVSNPDSFIMMSDIDNIPLTSDWYGSASTTVDIGDSFPAWYIDESLTPGETVPFTTYLKYKVPNNWLGIDVKLVATPIPGAVWLLGSGLIGIVGIRRRFSE